MESVISEVGGIALTPPCIIIQPIRIPVKEVIIEGEDSAICVGESVTLTASAHPTANVVGYTWTDENGTIVGAQSTLTVTKDIVGSYAYSVKVQFNAPISGVLSQTVTYDVVFITPPSIVSNPQTTMEFCVFESTVSTINTADYLINALKHEVINPDGDVTTMLSDGLIGIDYFFQQSGIYTIKGTSGNCPSVEVDVNVILTPIESPTITVLQQECNPGEPIALQANGDYDGNEFRWYGSDGTEIHTGATLENVTETATYTVRVLDDEGCPAEATYEVGVVDLGIDGNHIVTANETWNIHAGQDETITINGTVRILSGATLTIQDGAIVEFIGESSGIVVERGGRLEANYVTFQLSDCAGSGSYWRGLQVNGDSYSNHPSNYSSDIANHPNHGLIKLNHCTVREAKVGIRDYFLITIVPGAVKYMGGGIVDVWKCTFENNETAIRLGRTYNLASTESQIRDCDFINNQAFAPGISFYHHVVLDGLADAPVIKKNLFQTSINAPLPLSNKGVGIFILNSNFRIGTDCEEDANTFDNLFQGIDVYGIPTVQENTISHNVFQGVQKGITLNTTEMVDIIANDFDVPLGDPFPNDSYGILTHSSNDFTLRWNIFTTVNTPTSNAGNTRALVIRNSNVDENGAEFRDNTFNGLSFQDAVRFEQNNQGILPSCNTYVDCLADWHLAPDCQLTQIGEPCATFPDGQEILYNEQWHSGNVGWNILNESGTPLFVNHFNSNPTISTNTSLDECPVVGPSPCLDDNTQPCQPHIVQPSPSHTTIHAQIQVQHNIKGDLANQNFTFITNLLESKNNAWANRVLVPHYLHQADTGQAQITLARIPTSTPYYSVLDMLVNEVDNTDEATLQSLRNSHDAYTAALAESVLSLYFGQTYIRGVQVGNSSNKRVSNPASFGGGQLSYKLYPNPAKNQLHVAVKGTLEEETIQLTIYDLRGKQMIATPIRAEDLIDIAMLNTGMYFCFIQIEGEKPFFEKLMVTK